MTLLLTSNFLACVRRDSCYHTLGYSSASAPQLLSCTCWLVSAHTSVSSPCAQPTSMPIDPLVYPQQRTCPYWAVFGYSIWIQTVANSLITLLLLRLHLLILALLLSIQPWQTPGTLCASSTATLHCQRACPCPGSMPNISTPLTIRGMTTPFLSTPL